MYNNIGGKIKSLAKGVCIVEALGSIIVGVILAGDDALYLLLALIGPIIAWVSSWILYAFGELVEDISIMRHQITGEAKELELKSTEKNIAKQKSAQKQEEKTLPNKNFSSIAERWEHEISLLSTEELKNKCATKGVWSEEYLSFCYKELKKRENDTKIKAE